MTIQHMLKAARDMHLIWRQTDIIVQGVTILAENIL